MGPKGIQIVKINQQFTHVQDALEEVPMPAEERVLERNDTDSYPTTPDESDSDAGRQERGKVPVRSSLMPLPPLPEVNDNISTSSLLARRCTRVSFLLALGPSPFLAFRLQRSVSRFASCLKNLESDQVCAQSHV